MDIKHEISCFVKFCTGNIMISVQQRLKLFETSKANMRCHSMFIGFFNSNTVSHVALALEYVTKIRRKPHITSYHIGS
jgi:hypothetical protein